MSENLKRMWPYLGMGENMHMTVWSPDCEINIFRVEFLGTGVSAVVVA